jgi:hypothetical protein
MKKILHLFRHAGTIIRKYPLVLVAALLATVFAIVGFDLLWTMRSGLIEVPEKWMSFPYHKLCWILISGISLFYGLYMVEEVTGKKWIPLAGIPLLIVYYFIFPNDVTLWVSFDWIRLLVILLIHHLGVSFLPFLFYKNDELAFWSYNKTLFTNLVQTIVFVGILTLGLLLAIAAIENLFQVRFYQDKLYFYVAFFASIFGSSFVFLLFSSDGHLAMIKDRFVPNIEAFFVQYILIPLILTYGVILYAYMAKILISWSLPQGWVSYMVIAYAALGLISRLLVFPLFKETEKVWVKMFDRIFFYTLLPTLVLLFVAIFTRIFEYGVTPNRYYVFFLAVWISGISLFFAFYKKANIKVIPVSLFILALASLILPYYNALSFSVRSQKHEFLTLLEKTDLLEGDYINSQKEVSQSAADQLSSIAVFLVRNNETAFVKGYLKNPKEESFETPKFFGIWDFNEYLTIIQDEGTLNRYGLTILNMERKEGFLDVRDMDYILADGYMYSTDRFNLSGYQLVRKVNIWKNNEGRNFTFSLENNNKELLASHDLMDFIDSKLQTYYLRTNTIELSNAEMTYSFSLAHLDFTVVFHEINFYFYHPDNQMEGKEDDVEVYLNEMSFNCRYDLMVKEKPASL